jgi:septum formation protein
MRLILASASPRRADLLRAAGFEFETRAADVDERVQGNESPADYVQRLAVQKSAAVHAALTASAKASAVRRSFTRRRRGRAAGVQTSGDAQSREGSSVNGHRAFRPVDDVIVLGADTAVVIDGEILGKPRDDREARAMLRRLSARRHEVMTGISVRTGSRELARVETTAVYFAALGEDDIAWYVQSGEGRDKAGAYGIQGRASRFIPRIEGSYSNVVGLPVTVVCELIKAVGQLS